MAFTWIISQLDSSPSLDGLDKVIRTVHYRAQKQSQEYIAESYGCLGVDAPHEASFTPYDKVTKEMVESWLEAGLDTEEIEANLDSQIANFLNPPIVVYPLPFEN
jgi:hypothetical protein